MKNKRIEEIKKELKKIITDSSYEENMKLIKDFSGDRDNLSLIQEVVKELEQEAKDFFQNDMIKFNGTLKKLNKDDSKTIQEKEEIYVTIPNEILNDLMEYNLSQEDYEQCGLIKKIKEIKNGNV